jgi:hypothetical protein
MGNPFPLDMRILDDVYPGININPVTGIISAVARSAIKRVKRPSRGPSSSSASKCRPTSFMRRHPLHDRVAADIEAVISRRGLAMLNGNQRDFPP